LFIITLGAEAVGGVLSTVVVPVTVDVTVFSANAVVEIKSKAIKETIASVKFLMPSRPSLSW
jgi:hypothetical protein